jgi:hypothetical protein
MAVMNDSHNGDRSEVLRIGHDELVLQHRYEFVSVVNDIMIALWFIAGSMLFFSGALATEGVWCFLVGSVELLIRPVIRLTRLIHIEGPGEALASRICTAAHRTTESWSKPSEYPVHRTL